MEIDGKFRNNMQILMKFAHVELKFLQLYTQTILIRECKINMIGISLGYPRSLLTMIIRNKR